MKLENIKPRERVVLARRIEGKTFKEIAQELGVTSGRIRQIEATALLRFYIAIKPEFEWLDKQEEPRHKFHTACYIRVGADGLKSQCCYCVPHTGCEFSKRSARSK